VCCEARGGNNSIHIHLYIHIYIDINCHVKSSCTHLGGRQGYASARPCCRGAGTRLAAA
jgi:hypothetical protein